MYNVEYKKGTDNQSRTDNFHRKLNITSCSNDNIFSSKKQENSNLHCHLSPVLPFFKRVVMVKER